MNRRNDEKILHGMPSYIHTERLYISSDRGEEKMPELRKGCQGKTDSCGGIHKG